MAKYRGKHNYLGAWGYVLLDILYAIPLVGFIFLLVHAFSNENENRRHYARSFFARLLLGVIICAVVLGIMAATVGLDGLSDAIEGTMNRTQNMGFFTER